MHRGQLGLLARLLRELDRRAVRYVTIGVWGANYYALSGSTVFHTEDRDLFLPLEPENLWATNLIAALLGIAFFLVVVLAEKLLVHRAPEQLV